MHTDQVNNQLSKDLVEYFKAGEYDQALDKLFALKNDLSAGSFHYNLGLILIGQNNVAGGKLNLLKANKLGFFTEGFDLEMEKLNSVLKVEQKKSWSDDLYFTASSIGSTEYLILSFLLVIISLFGVLKTHSKNKVTIGFLLLTSFSPYITYKMYFKNLDPGVVLETSPIRRGPSKIFEAEGVAGAGAEVILGKRFNKWIRVISPANSRGWVLADKVGLL